MGWTKLDDEFPWHPKVRRAGPLATALHVAALCHCNKYLTDGVVDRAVLPSLVDLSEFQRHTKNHTQLADRLVSAGLWSRSADGENYTIHDFLKYNPTRDQVISERESAKRRRENGRRSPDVRNTISLPVPTPVPTPDVLPERPEDGPEAELPAPAVIPRKERPKISTFEHSDFMVTEELKTWARSEIYPPLSALELANGTSEFVDYWLTQPRKRTLAGWQRTWKERMKVIAERKLARAS